MNMSDLLLKAIEIKENAAANAVRPVAINGITLGDLGWWPSLGAYITVPNGIDELAKLLAEKIRTAFVKSGNTNRKYNYFERNGVTYISVSYTSEEISADAEIWSEAPYV